MCANTGDVKVALVGQNDCDLALHRNKVYNILGETAGVGIRYDSLTDGEQHIMFDAMGIPREGVDDKVVG